MDLKKVFDAALAAQQSVDMASACKGYELLLIHQPSAESALALIGIAYIDNRSVEDELGMRFLSRSLRVKPDEALTWANLGLASLKTGDSQRSYRAFKNAISLGPNQRVFYQHLFDHFASFWGLDQRTRFCRYWIHLDPLDETVIYQLGLSLHDGGDYQASQKVFLALCERSPMDSRNYLYLASSCQGLAQNGTALNLFAHVLQIIPDHLPARMNYSYLCIEKRLYSDATRAAKEVIMLAPDFSDGYYNFGLALQGLEDLDAAERSYSRCIRLKPDQPMAYLNLGSVALEKSNLADSRKASECSIILAPEYCEAYINLGNAYKQESKPREALLIYDRALDLMPELPDALSGKGLIYLELSKFEQASYCFDEAIRLDPTDAGFKYNKAHLNLLRGDYSSGWPLFEWRWKTKSMRREIGPGKIPDAPLWQGRESLRAKRILIWPEQGFGDALQFSRYIPELQALGASVVFEVQPALKRLMEDSFPGVEIVTSSYDKEDVDFHCPLMSLPLAFSTTLETIPGKYSYLRARPLDQKLFGDLFENVSGFKVGLVWSGGLRMDQPETWAVFARRDIALSELHGLNMRGITFFSLQKGEPAESQLRVLQDAGWAGPKIIPVGDRLHDFADTAMILGALDLLISVDTSTAHLAAAMGKPVWLLNRFDTCWRWLIERNDSPWYPTLRLFRQDDRRSWTPVVTSVSEALLELVLSAQKKG